MHISRESTPNAAVPTSLPVPPETPGLSRAEQSEALRNAFALRARSFAYALTLLFLPLYLHASGELVWDNRRAALLVITSGLLVAIAAANEMGLRRAGNAACVLFCMLLAFLVVPVRPEAAFWAMHKLLITMIVGGALFLSSGWFLACAAVSGGLYSSVVMSGAAGTDTAVLWIELGIAFSAGLIVHLALRQAARAYNELALRDEARLKFFSEAIEEARNSERRFKRLSDASREALVFHAEGKILDANRSALELFGFEANEVAGKPVEELLGKGFNRFATEISDPANTHLSAIRIRRKDGSESDALAFNHLVMFPEGSVHVLGLRRSESRPTPERNSKICFDDVLLN